MKKHLWPSAVLITLLLVTRAVAADDNPAQKEVDDLKLELEKWKTKNAILAEQNAGATAAAAAAEKKAADRQKQYADLLTNLTAAAEKVPTGSYASADGMAISPAAASLEFEAMTTVLREVSTAATSLGTKPVIFVTALPEPADTFGYEYFVWKTTELREKYQSLKHTLPGTDLDTDAKIKDYYGLSDVTFASLYPNPKTTVLMETGMILAALPQLVSVVRAFFVSDVSEKSAKGIFPDSALISKFIEVRPSGGGEIYVSFGAYARTKWSAPENSEVVRRFTELSHNHTVLSMAVTDLEAKAAELKEAVATAAKAVKDETDKTKLDDLTKKQTAAESHLARVTAYALKFKELQTEINGLLAKSGDFSAKDGYLPALLKEELFSLAMKDEVRFVSLSAASDYMSVTEVKSFWSKKYYISATVAIDLKVSDARGQVLQAGVHKKSFARKLGKPDALSNFTWDGGPVAVSANKGASP